MIGFVFRGTPALLRQVHADANIINRNGRLPPQIHIAFTEGRLQLTPVSVSAGKWCQQEAIEVAAVDVPTGVGETVREVLAYTCEDPLLYARVDFIPDGDQWLVMEFEATEPRLFLETAPAAPARFARAVRAALSATDT